MGCQQTRNPGDPAQHTLFEITFAECTFHFTAYRFPALRADPPMDAAIGNDLNIAVRQQQIDQHAVVVFGVPDLQRRKHVKRALACGQSAQQECRIQRVFDGKTNLTSMPGFRLRNRLFDARQRRRRK